MIGKGYNVVFFFCVFLLAKSYADKTIIVSRAESIDSFGDDKAL